VPIAVIKSKDLKRSTSRTKKAAASATVFITEYGKPAFVMLSIEAYRGLIADVGLPAAFDDFDPKLSYLLEHLRGPSQAG
jgi:hypothetical protein